MIFFLWIKPVSYTHLDVYKRQDFTGWRNAVRMQPPKGKLSAKEFLPIRIWEHWTAESVKELPNGNWLVDMGKNSAGFVRLRLWNTGKYEGRKVEMYPAEVLKADGSGVDQASCTQSCDTLWQCAVKDSYIIAGTGTAVSYTHLNRLFFPAPTRILF